MIFQSIFQPIFQPYFSHISVDISVVFQPIFQPHFSQYFSQYFSRYISADISVNISVNIFSQIFQSIFQPLLFLFQSIYFVLELKASYSTKKLYICSLLSITPDDYKIYRLLMNAYLQFINKEIERNKIEILNMTNNDVKI
jgi:hypothetical protein